MIKIAIDGPGGAGKSTVAKAVAAKLGIVYVDTGALYRTIGYYVRSKNIDPKDRVAVAACLPEINIEVKYENGAQHVYLNGFDPGEAIRTPEMSMYASAVSAIGEVRAFLLETQKDVTSKAIIIMARLVSCPMKINIAAPAAQKPMPTDDILNGENLSDSLPIIGESTAMTIG